MTAKTLTLPRPTGALALISTVVIGSLLMALSARLAAPMWPVPVTLQTLTLCLIGAYAGWRAAGLTLLAYLGQGLIGLPVFAAGGGPAYFAGPTGGYLLAYPVAAALVGWCAEKGMLRNWMEAAGVFIAAHAVIFVGGVSWLSAITGPEAAIAGGFIPFIPGMILKVAFAVALTRTIRPKA